MSDHCCLVKFAMVHHNYMMINDKSRILGVTDLSVPSVPFRLPGILSGEPHYAHRKIRFRAGHGSLTDARA